MVSESVLCASREHRERIRQAEPRAIGGDTEGAAVFAAAERAGVPWAVVKAISDWGFDKDDRHQRLAADNAASLVICTVQLGGLSRAAVDGPLARPFSRDAPPQRPLRWPPVTRPTTSQRQ